MVAIAGNLTESFGVTDWRVSAYKCKDGSLSGTTTTSGTTYSVTCVDTDICNVAIAPVVDKRWSTGTLIALNEYVVPSSPDTTPKLYKATSAPAGDTNFASSSLKCHFDNNWTDVSANPKTLTVNGAAALSNTWSKFGGYSAYFPGASTAYVTAPDGNDFEFGSGEFIIRFWMYPTEVSARRGVINKTPNSSYGSFNIYILSGHLRLDASSTGSTWNIASALDFGTITANTEYFVELTKVGDTIYTFLNGVAGATTTTTAAMINGTYPLAIGTYGVGSSYNYVGYLDDLEIFKGVGGHTTGYTPPTSAFLLHDGGTCSATEPTWPASGTVNESVAEGTITYTYIADLDDAMFKTLGVKIPV